MATFISADGSIAEQFQLGVSGLLLKHSSSTLKVRNTADNADLALEAGNITASGNIAANAGGITAQTLDTTGDITSDDNVIVGRANQLRLRTDNSDNYVALKAPNSVGSNWTLTFPAAVAGSSNKILATTDNAGTLGWVDLPEQGSLQWLDAARVASTANLAASYSNGSSGVGATLTNSGSQAALAIDGVTLSVNDRVLVKNQSTQSQNGVYKVTNQGSGSANWVLTRTDDASGNNLVGASIFVNEGTVNADSAYACSAPDGTITFGSDNIVFTKYLVGSISFDQIDGSAVITSGEGILANSTNDSALPTARAVFDETKLSLKVYHFRYELSGSNQIAGGAESVLVNTNVTLPDGSLVDKVVADVSGGFNAALQLFVGFTQANGSANASDQSDAQSAVNAQSIQSANKYIFQEAAGTVPPSGGRKIQAILKNGGGSAVNTGTVDIYLFTTTGVAGQVTSS